MTDSGRRSRARADTHWSTVNRVSIGTALLLLAAAANAQPIIYTDEALFLAELATLGGSTIHESFEDGAVWADSRNSITSPGSTPAVASQRILWTSNFSQNAIATGTVGGSAPDGAFAIYSLPHGVATDSGLYCDDAEDPIPIECWQNDGVKLEAEPGGTLFAFGGRIDTANSGKVTFLLDGFDINGNGTDNLDNWQREGDFADNWAFVGVIDPAGFSSAELRELRGKDSQQVLLFTDDFTIRRSAPALPAVPALGGVGQLLTAALCLAVGYLALGFECPSGRLGASNHKRRGSGALPQGANGRISR